MARLNAFEIALSLAIGATAVLGWEAYQTEQNDVRLNHSGVEELHTGPYTGPLPTDTTEGRDIIIP